MTLAFGLLTIGAGWVGYLELQQYLAAGPKASEQFVALREDRLEPGLSVSSMTMLLDGCNAAMTSVYGRTRSSDERRKVAEACQRRAASITAANPSFSYGWYVEAIAASILGDEAAAERALEMSWRTGPTEQWIAELRVALAEQQLAPGEAVATWHERDLELLVRSRRGVRSIARRYIAHAEFRERITAIVERMDEESQRYFLHVLNETAGN